MAEAGSADPSTAEEKRPVVSSSESVSTGTTISRVKLLDTMVDTFLQKLVAAGSYQRFTDCYKRVYQLQPEMTQRIYDRFITQLETSIREEISEIKKEGNLEAVLNSLDKIVEEGKNCKEPACLDTLLQAPTVLVEGEAGRTSYQRGRRRRMRALGMGRGELGNLFFADAKPSGAESGKAFMSKQEGSEVVKRPRRFADYGMGAPAPYPDPLEPRREVCELNPNCDELADHIGFQDAYQRFYGTTA
ncbi:polyamine-modulated factor 1 isoform X4 [Sciurus carolinensis]|uniref:polyamine-modulated factor 1 isoform X4 n=1 Tax=Sciurus carolinensis TaxID=30640 RepID=UPI001FB45A72|nr:polyamine-modulated factor 1 isoform X4 [Sciurus carolinensis]